MRTCLRLLVFGLALPSAALPGPARPGQLDAAPMAGRATPSSITLTLIAGAEPVRVRLVLRREESEEFRPVRFHAEGPDLRGSLDRSGGDEEVLVAPHALAELVLGDLAEGAAYRYRLQVREAAPGRRQGAAVAGREFTGRFVTVRPVGVPFSFCVYSDPHFFPREFEPRPPPESLQSPEWLRSLLSGLEWYRSTRDRIGREFARVADQINQEQPDFVVGLGDQFDLHGLGFNPALTTRAMAEAAHAEARGHLALLHDAGAQYQVLGNWEGESGDHRPEHRRVAREARLRYQVNPRPDTSPLGGSPEQDYYAWRWGDVLCVVLNVRGYTPTRHLLGETGDNDGGPEDFTLGEEQRAFLERVLEETDLRYRLLFIHHAVGGRGGNAENSAYGRGGGRAAGVGEQAWVHDVMRGTGVQVFFYGHDHVFTDLVVDGIHYTLPGTTGAPWRFGREETGYERSWPQAGHARVQVTPEQLSVELVDLTGEVLHSYQVAPVEVEDGD